MEWRIIMKTKVYSRDVILILASSFFFLSSPMLVTPLITGFSASLGAGAALTGIIGGLMNICSLFCRPFVGNLADKISKYRLSFIGSILMLLSCIGYIASFRPALVIFFRIMNGIGYSCCSVCMSTWMSNMLPKEKIGSGMGVYGMMNALGMAVAPAIGVSLYEKAGYRIAFAVAAVFAALTVISIQFVHDKGEPIKQSGISHEEIKVVDRKVIPIAAIIMLFAVPYCATQSFLVSYAASMNLNITVSIFFPLYAVILLLLRLSLRNLFDKKPFSFFMVLSSLSAFAAIFLLAYMKNNMVLFFAAAFMAGGYGIMCSVCQSTAILLAGKGKRGLANSTYYIGLDLGMSFGPILGGILYGNVDKRLFYPILAITVPLGCIVYYANRHALKSIAKPNTQQKSYKA